MISFDQPDRANFVRPSPSCSVGIPRVNFTGCATTTITGKHDSNFIKTISETWSPSTVPSKEKVYVVRNQIILEPHPAEPNALEFANSFLFKRFPKLKEMDKTDLFKQLMEEED